MSGRNSKRKLYRKHSEIESAQKKTTTDFDDVKTNGSKQIREKKSATNKAQLNLSPAC
jgi:hypothetical protein